MRLRVLLLLLLLVRVRAQVRSDRIRSGECAARDSLLIKVCTC